MYCTTIVRKTFRFFHSVYCRRINPHNGRHCFFYSIRTSILIWKLFFTIQKIDIYHQPLEFNSKLNGSIAFVQDSVETCYCTDCILEDKVKISYETESENNETNIAKDFNMQIAIKKKDQHITGILRSESNELRKIGRQ